MFAFVLLIDHCGSAGHCNLRVTASRIHQVFTWKGMEEDIESFCSPSIHCATVDGLHRSARSYAHNLHALRPNTYIHYFDFCNVEGIVKGGYQYILAVKDDFSNCCWLVP